MPDILPLNPLISLQHVLAHLSSLSVNIWVPNFVFDNNLLYFVSLRVHVDAQLKMKQPSLVARFPWTPHFCLDYKFMYPLLNLLRQLNFENLFFKWVVFVIVNRL